MWPSGSSLTSFRSAKPASCVTTAGKSRTSTTATAATVAAAAAVAALQQAEEQLNRILEESRAEACQTVHIADQLLMGMASTYSSDLPELLSHDLPYSSRASTSFPKRSAGQKNAFGDAAVGVSLAAPVDGAKPQKVSFFVRQPVEELGTPAEQNSGKSA